MRISEWAKTAGITVRPFDAVAKPPHGATVLRVKDIFTTRDGSWDVSNKRGSIEQWARDTYLSRQFDDAGADRHLFGRVEAGGRFDATAYIHYWTHKDNSNHTEQPVKRQSGWANIPMYASSSFVYERGEQGPWAWRPMAEWTDIVIGGGLPSREHWSFFVVWSAETYQGTITPPIDQPTDPIDPPIDGSLAAQVAKNTADIKKLMAWADSFDGEL